MMHLLALLSALMLGEALATPIRMGFVDPQGRRWPTGRNRFLLMLDLLCATILLVSLGMTGIRYELILAAIVIAVCVHARRSLEYGLKLKNRYCFNRSLFLVNSIKLVGLTSLLLYFLVHRNQGSMILV